MPNWAGLPTVQHGTTLRFLGAEQELPGEEFGIPHPEPGFFAGLWLWPLIACG